jgi:hypothetical protein
MAEALASSPECAILAVRDSDFPEAGWVVV